jgi:hypothetical protein
MTEHQHEVLEYLAWRYATIVGIVGPSSIDLSDADIVADRQRWPDLAREEDGMPIFDDDAGAAWMAEVAEMPIEDCLKVLIEVWER